MTTPPAATPDTFADDAPRPRPRRRLRRAARSKPDHCLNCGRECASFDYCPDCGQENQRHDVSLLEVFRDAWDEFAKIDGKLVKTAVPLLFKPGFLTHEFIQGRRVRYISPFKMYLVVSFFFFIALGWKAQQGLVQNLARGQTALQERLREEREAAARGDAKPGAAAAARPAPQAAPSPAAAAPNGSETRDNEAKPRRKRRNNTLRINSEGFSLAALPETLDAYRAEQDKLPLAKRDESAVRFVKHCLILYRSGDTGALLSNVFDAASKMMFLLLPVYALLLKLLHIRSSRLYVEHFVFALHTHTVVFLFLLVELLLPLPWLGPTLFALFVAHNFIALRRVYGQGVGKTFVKGTLLAAIYAQVLLFALVLTVLASLAVQSGFLAWPGAAR